MPGREHKITVFNACRRPPEIVRRLDGPSIVVDPRQRKIEVEARIHEIVRIAAEKCYSRFGSEHQANIGPHPISIEVISPAAVERHHFTAKTRLFLALVLECRDRRVALGIGPFAIRRTNRGSYGCGYILCRIKMLYFRARARTLRGARSREQPFSHEVLASSRQLLDARQRDVMVR